VYVVVDVVVGANADADVPGERRRPSVRNRYLPGAALTEERDLLERIVSMLTKMRPAAR
jgi:hypothetical protein